MKSTAVIVALGVALAGVGLSIGLAAAQDTQGIIKEREALMKKQGADMGAVKSFLDGKNDQAKATDAATDLTDTMKKIPDVFPAGTGGQSPDGKYATKPEIWSDPKGFLAARDAGAGKAAVLLEAVQGGDKAKIQAAFADLGKNGCGACHSKFREEIKK